MVITFDELWNSLEFYPDKINYFDRSENIEDTIEDHSEMDKFAEEKEGCEVEFFSIYKYGLGFGLSVEFN